MINQKIKCLRRFAELVEYNEILSFLNKERLITEEWLTDFNKSPQQSELLYLHLKKLYNEGKLTSLFYEWEILPEERITITISTINEYKTFSFNAI